MFSMVVVNNKIGIRYGMNGPTLKMKNIGGSRYEWNIYYDGVQYNIFQDGFRYECNISNLRSRYECNIEYKGVKVWV